MIKLVKSMTGFGTRSTNFEKTNLIVEIKTVNSRYLDFYPKLPHSIQHLESRIKKRIQTHFERGRIEITVTILEEDLTDKSLVVDWGLLDDYMEKLNQAKSRYNLEGNIPISALTTIDGVFSLKERSIQTDDLVSTLLEEVEQVAKLVTENRAAEGIFLIKDISNRINSMQSMLKLIEDCKENVSAHYRERIKQRIIQSVGKEFEFEEIYLIQEIAILAEKGDISEEITRLHSHLTHLNAVISGGGAIGRKLDFITQEMHRETNTIGAKSIDPQISETVVKMKSELEKIKEQVQNIE